MLNLGCVKATSYPAMHRARKPPGVPGRVRQQDMRRRERLSGSNIYSLDDIVGELHGLCSEVEAARMQEIENGAYLIALTRMLKHLGYGALILVFVLDFL